MMHGTTNIKNIGEYKYGTLVELYKNGKPAALGEKPVHTTHMGCPGIESGHSL